jgi:Xaa-Pro dipeptidase
VFRIVEMMDLELVEMDYTERGAKILLRGLEVPENLVIKTIRDVLI